MKTKLLGILIFIVAILKMVIDIFDGGQFGFQEHSSAILGGLGGLGLVTLRLAVEKVLKAVQDVLKK